MNEAELHTLDTVQTSYGSQGSAISSGNTSMEPASLHINQAENDNDIRLNKPHMSKMVTPTVASASVSHEEAFANPSLESACQEGDLQTVEQLLTPENLNCGGFHHAAANNHWRICKLFLSRGADINHRLQPLNATPILWAARQGQAYIVKLLLDHGADPWIVDTSGFTLLHLAVHSSNVLMVIYIIHLEAVVDKADIGNRTPLHWAIVQGDHLSVDALLKAGASSNMKDGEGASPLQLATYVSQSDTIVALLLLHGADPASVSINVLDPPLAWVRGCKIAGRYPNGTLPRSRLSPELAKGITSCAPAFVIPFALYLPKLIGSTLLGVLLGLAGVWQSKRLLDRHVIPLYWRGEKAVIQSTLLAGSFLAIFICVVYFWAIHIAPVVLPSRPWSSLGIIVSILAITPCYFFTMFMDPGKIEPKSMTQRLRGMNTLLEEGTFDSTHLCVRTFVNIPARGQYDFYLERVICRYDHYCPWLYNAIGLRNHRCFMAFLLFLAIGLPLAGLQYVDYVQEVGFDSFSVGLCLLVLVQSVWIYALLIVQLIQISRGITSYEASHAKQLQLYKTDPLRAYSSLPKDHPKAPEILGDFSSASSLLKHSSCQETHSHKHKAPLWARLTGFSQLCLVLKLSKERMHDTDFGLLRNCTDFWFGGGSLFYPHGNSGSIGGASVDYSTLSKIPARPMGNRDQYAV